MATPQLLDQFGMPVDRAALTQEKARPSLAGVRNPWGAPPPGDFTPQRVARALRAADEGDPVAYMEMAERVEELDGHYLGVLSTRKRAVAQLPITVEAASDDAAHVRHADMVRDWLTRDELQDELFDILDAVGKGYSLTEIVWDTSERAWRPGRLLRRPQSWFAFAREDGETPLLRTDSGDEPLTPYGWIVARIQSKSGLPLRSGLARLALWHWMFKSFSNRDWAIFNQSYGQPIRIGKYAKGATQADIDVLWGAVANIASDLGAVIPQDMLFELVESKSAAANAALFKDRLDWLDRQMSKAVLGQTATTDAIAGGHAVGREHRQVQEDIERADAAALAATLNQQLVRPWIDLEFGKQDKYPRLKIGREETVDLQLVIDALPKLVPLGLRVEKSVVNDKLGLPDPDAGAELLTARAQAEPPAAAAAGATAATPQRGDPAPPPAPVEAARARAALHAAQADRARRGDAIDAGVETIIRDHGYEMIAPMVAGLEAEIALCASLAEVEELLGRRLADLDTSRLTHFLARAAFAARLSGEAGEEL